MFAHFVTFFDDDAKQVSSDKFLKFIESRTIGSIGKFKLYSA